MWAISFRYSVIKKVEKGKHLGQIGRGGMERQESSQSAVVGLCWGVEGSKVGERMAPDFMLTSSPLCQVCTCHFGLALVLKGHHSFFNTPESFYLIILGVNCLFCNGLFLFYSFCFVLFGFIHFLAIGEILKKRLSEYLVIHLGFCGFRFIDCRMRCIGIKSAVCYSS